MSIESQVSTAGAARGPAHSAAHHGHGRVAEGASVGSFAAMLMDLGTDAVALEDIPAIGGQKDERADLLAPVQGDMATQPATATEAPPVAVGLVGVVSTTPMPADDIDLLRLRAAAGSRASGGNLAEANLPATPPDAELQALLSQRQETGLGRPQSRPGGGGGVTRAIAATQAQEPGTGLSKALLRGEDMAARLGWKISDVTGGGLSAPATPLVAASDPVVRVHERRHDKAGENAGGVGAPGALASLTSVDGTRVEVPRVAADPGQMTEMRVAEQVSYWIGRGVQNAELELDGLGEGSVSVSIEMQGQQARIEFRAEQMQTRQVLEGSVSHLRDLLAREGLVLSGVSVGAFGADGEAPRQAPPRAGVRRTEVAVPEQPGATLRTGSATGRAVDYFV